MKSKYVNIRLQPILTKRVHLDEGVFVSLKWCATFNPKTLPLNRWYQMLGVKGLKLKGSYSYLMKHDDYTWCVNQ